MTLLSLCKCSPFSMQKDPFWSAKGVLLKNNRRRACQKSKQYAPKGQVHIAQGNALR